MGAANLGHCLSRAWRKRAHTAFRRWQVFALERSHSQSDAQNARRLLRKSRLRALKHVVVARVNRVKRHALLLWRGVTATQGVYTHGVKLRHRLVERVGARWLRRHQEERVRAAFALWSNASRNAAVVERSREARATDRRRHMHMANVCSG